MCERVRVCLLNGTFESVGCLSGFGAFPQCLIHNAHAPTVRQQCYAYMSSIKTKYNIRTGTYDGSTLILIRSPFCVIHSKGFQSESQCLPNLHIIHTFHIHFQGRISACVRVHCETELREKGETLSHNAIAVHTVNRLMCIRFVNIVVHRVHASRSLLSVFAVVVIVVFVNLVSKHKMDQMMRITS